MVLENDYTNSVHFRNLDDLSDFARLAEYVINYRTTSQVTVRRRRAKIFDGGYCMIRLLELYFSLKDDEDKSNNQWIFMEEVAKRNSKVKAFFEEIDGRRKRGEE